MTREEAHEILSNGLVNAPSEHEWCMAFKKAIEALEKAPCEDAISRQDVKDELPSVAPVEIEPKLLINTDEVVKKLCNIIIQRESKEYYSIKITANERCENVIADIWKEKEDN